MEEVLITLITALSGLIGILLTGYVDNRSKYKKALIQIEKLKNEESKIIKSGLCCILRNSLIQCHSKYMEDDYVTYVGKECFEKMYQSYHALGGNGMIDTLYEDVMKLETRKSLKN